MTPEQVERLGLEPGTWWGVRTLDDDGEHKSLVTTSAAARDAMDMAVEDGVRPPAEFEAHLASLVLEIPGLWLEDFN